jgi:hypothetical protein
VQPSSIAGPPIDQGIREIRAIAACADAYRAIVGRTTERLELASRDERKKQIELRVGPASSDAGAKKEDKAEKSGDTRTKSAADKVIPPALGTVAGGLAPAAQNIESAVLAVLIGGLVWLLSWFAVSRTVRRQSSQEMHRILTTEPEWNSERIERDFPKLLARVKDAGFAPIFILDELDKMEDANEKLASFLRYSKHLVTAEAAFLFLTNRDYYERLIIDDRKSTDNLPTKTFYTYRIFVRYEPDNYRQFLLSRVDRSSWRDSDRDRLTLGLVAWATILMYRTAMLPFDFNRQLMLMVDAQGRFNDQDPELPLRHTVYRQQLAMQLGIETITRDVAVRERMKELPYYSQYIYDTLYYVRQVHEREQSAGNAPIIVTSDTIRTYLWRRAEPKTDELIPDNFIPPDEATFLFELFRRYIDLLRNPARIDMRTKISWNPMKIRHATGGFGSQWRAVLMKIGRLSRSAKKDQVARNEPRNRSG